MDIEWRTIQFFISSNGVCEVQSDETSHKKLRCSCKDFGLLARCKHTKFVKDRIGDTGTYTVRLADDTDEETVTAALEDADMFRKFLIYHAKIEALE